MSTIDEGRQQRLWPAIVWTLRLTVVLQCLGNWRWLTRIEETPLLHWMLAPSDIGGLAWPEATALLVQQVAGWFVLLAGALLLWRPHAVVLVPLVMLQLLIAVAMWQIAEGYPLQAEWVSPHLLTLFPFVTQLGRIAAPLGLLLVCQRESGDVAGERRIDRTIQMLRFSAAVVFLAHGIEAWQLNPKFVDLIITSAQRVLGISVTESAAQGCLATIGGIDMVIAIACVGVRSRTVMVWMAFWGLATAMSRLLANGWQASWHETFVRAPHFGIPLAVALWWLLLECRESAKNEIEPASSPGKQQSVSATN
jgi:hypothetical protein